MTPTDATTRTNEPHQHEPPTESSNHSGDSPAHGETIESHPAGSLATSPDSWISVDSSAMNGEHQGTSQSFGIPQVFYSTSKYVYNQYTFEWIDELDAFGGRLVRAAIDNASPNVWDRAIDARRHFIGRTYHMEQAVLEGVSGNPKNVPDTPSSRVRRAARQRHKRGTGSS